MSETREELRDRIGRISYEAGTARRCADEGFHPGDFVTWEDYADRHREPLMDGSEAVYAEALRDVIDAFGDLEWPIGEDTYELLSVQVHRFATERGIDLSDKGGAE